MGGDPLENADLSPAGLHDAREELVALYHRCCAIDLRPVEDELTPSGLEDARDRIAGCLEQLLEIERRLIKRSEEPEHAPATKSDPHARRFVVQLESLAEQHSRLTDIGFFVRLELQTRLRSLRGLTFRRGDWTGLTECDGALRAVRKGTGTLEQTLCQSLGLESTIDFKTELQAAIAVRRRYARFRRQIGDLNVGENGLKVRLRRGGTAIATLIGSDEYPAFRVGDRFQLRQFQRRILDWLRGEGLADEPAGERIWHDFSTFTEMLVLISRREELVTYDAETLKTLSEAVGDAGWSSDLVGRAATLEGLDEELDRLILSPSSARPAMLRARATELLAHLQPQLAGRTTDSVEF